MPVALGRWFSPGAVARTKSFLESKKQTVEMLEPGIQGAAASAAEDTSSLFSSLIGAAQSVGQGVEGLGRRNLGGLARGFTPTGAGELQAGAFQGLRPQEVGGRAAQRFFEDVPEPGEQRRLALLKGELDRRGLRADQFQGLLEQARSGDQGALRIVEPIIEQIPAREGLTIGPPDRPFDLGPRVDPEEQRRRLATPLVAADERTERVPLTISEAGTFQDPFAPGRDPRTVEEPIARFVAESVLETFGVPGTDLNLRRVPEFPVGIPGTRFQTTTSLEGIATELARPTNIAVDIVAAPVLAPITAALGAAITRGFGRILRTGAMQRLIARLRGVAADGAEATARRQTASDFADVLEAEFTVTGETRAPVPGRRPRVGEPPPPRETTAVALRGQPPAGAAAPQRADVTASLRRIADEAVQRRAEPGAVPEAPAVRPSAAEVGGGFEARLAAQEAEASARKARVEAGVGPVRESPTAAQRGTSVFLEAEAERLLKEERDAAFRVGLSHGSREWRESSLGEAYARMRDDIRGDYIKARTDEGMPTTFTPEQEVIFHTTGEQHRLPGAVPEAAPARLAEAPEEISLNLRSDVDPSFGDFITVKFSVGESEEALGTRLQRILRRVRTQEAEFIPSDEPQFLELIDTVRRNEGEAAAGFVEGLEKRGLETLDTHRTPDSVTVHVGRLSEENRRVLGAVPEAQPAGAPVSAEATGAVPPVTRAPEPAPAPIEPQEVVPRGTIDPDAPPLVPIGGGAPRLATELRPFDEVVNEVVTSDNPVVRAVVGKTGLNPSVLENTPIGRATVAFWRQRVAGDQAAKLGIARAFDIHAQRFTGLRPNIVIRQVGSRKGLVTNVKSRTEGASLAWQDVYSRPGNYNLKPAQQAEIADYHRFIDELEDLRVQAGLKPRATRGKEAVTDGWFYTPRQVKGIRGVELRRPSNPGLQRHFDEAAEGQARGIDYDTDPRATGDLHGRLAYKEIADKQFSDHIEQLQAEAMQTGRRTFVTPKELVPEPVLQRMSNATLNRMAAERQLRALRAERLRLQTGGRFRGEEARAQETLRAARGPRRAQLAQDIKASQARLQESMKEFDAAKKRYSKELEAARRAEVAPGSLFGLTEDTISIRNWRNRFFPTEDADKLKRGIEEIYEPLKESPFVSVPRKTGDFVRFMASVGDFAEPFIQGQTVFGVDPPAWARSALRHYQAFFDPTVQARIMDDYADEFAEMVQHGTPIGDPEFFAALQSGGFSPGKLLELLPKGEEARTLLQQAGKQTFGRFQASYNTGLGSSRAMLTRILKKEIPDAAERQRFIRNVTGGLDSRALGVAPPQRAVEGFLGAFSPRLLRSTTALISDVRFGPLDPRGRAAMTTLAQLASVAAGLYILSGLALGKDWETIKTGLNPLEGKRFLSHQVNGDWIGGGGQVRAITQLLAHMGKNWDNPKAFFELDLDNPLWRFWMFRGAPAFNLGGAAIEAGTGGEVNALPFDEVENPLDFTKHVGKSALPFVVQGAMEGEQPLTLGAALGGARTSAETPGDELARRFEEREGRPFNRETDKDIVRTKHPDLADLLFRSEGAEVVEEALQGPIADLTVVAEQVRQGNPRAPEEFRRQFSDFKKIAFGASQAAFAGIDFRDPESEAGKLRQQFNEIEPFGPEFFDEETAQPDWRAVEEARDDLIGQIDALSPGFKDAYEARLRLPPELQDVEARLLQASSLRDDLDDIQKYTPFPVSLQRKLEDFRRDMLRAREQRKDQIGSENVESVADFMRIVGPVRGQSANFIEAAINIGSSRWRTENLNSEYERFIVTNRDPLLLFYPDLRNDRIGDLIRAVEQVGR